MDAGRRVALITGTSSGIGSAIAERLAVDGMHVVCVARSSSVHDQAADLVKRGLAASAFTLDVSDTPAAIAAVERVVAEQGRLDVLVNNAGMVPAYVDRAPTIEEQPIETWLTELAVNLTAPFILCRAAVPHMKKQRWGRIVNITSRAGRTLVPAASHGYSASKAGLIGLTRYLAGELALHGVTVNAIAPGRVEVGKDDPDAPLVAQTVAGNPMRRAGRPPEIAEAVSYAVSEGAGFMTGAVIDVNGGAFMG